MHDLDSNRELLTMKYNINDIIKVYREYGRSDTYYICKILEDRVDVSDSRGGARTGYIITKDIARKDNVQHISSAILPEDLFCL